MAKIWGIADGEYSDYRVLALFEREEDARAALANGMGDDVQEFDFVRAGGPLPRKVAIWDANSGLSVDGDPDRVTVHRYERWVTDVSDPTKRPTVEEWDMDYRFGHRIVVTAGSEEAARKVLADRMAKWRAAKLGL